MDNHSGGGQGTKFDNHSVIHARQAGKTQKLREITDKLKAEGKTVELICSHDNTGKGS